jgi:hypothetical protein
MGAKFIAKWILAFLITLPAGASRSNSQAAAPALSPADAQALVQRALANEIDAAKNAGRPMRYTLHKITPRLTTTKQIIETSDGDVARLIEVNGKSLNPEAEQREMARLDALAVNQADQDHRKQTEDSDRARAIKILRALPMAFAYTYTGPDMGATGPVEMYSFAPKPGYSPSGMETQILTGLTGNIAVDPVAGRVARLEGHLRKDVNFGWGIVGRLNKGGWIVIDQAPVVDGQWRATRLQLVMTGRILFITKNYDMLEEQSNYRPVAEHLDYREAIGMLKKEP